MLNNPVKYTDPSGHYVPHPVQGCTLYDDDYNCVAGTTVAVGKYGGQDPFHVYLSPKEYAAAAAKAKTSLDDGLAFVNALTGTEGWWSDYMENSYDAWKFLIALAYGYEVGPTWSNTKMQELMPQAFANKIADLTATYGKTAGLLIFLGSMQTIRIRIAGAESGSLDKPAYLGQSGKSPTGAYAKTAGVWDGSSRSSGDNAPYDFGNPDPQKQNRKFLAKLQNLYTKCQALGQQSCDTTWNGFSLPDVLYAVVSQDKFGNWTAAFVVTYDQNTNISK